jgi:transporter family-2 protein
MSNTTLYILLALAAGICIPTQSGINAQLASYAKSSVLAATISFLVGSVGLFVYLGVMRIPIPMAALGVAPWWAWSGGILGAFFVASTIFLVPQLGATTMLSLVIAGQMIASLVYDHYGALAFPVHPISPLRILGVVLVAAGVILIKKF